MSRMIFVNLPVADVAASRAFFERLGFAFDPRFSGDEAAGLIVNDSAWVMLVDRERCASLTAKPIADAHASCEVEVCLTAESREAADAIADAALAAGGKPAGAPQDHELMHGRSFLDLDGHQWEVVWMDTEASEAAPDEHAQVA